MTDIDWGPLAEPVHDDIQDLSLPWRDNAWLMISDPGTGVFGTVHVSTSPNAGARRAQCNFVVGGHQVRISELLEPGTLRGDSIHYELEGVVEVDHPELRMSLRLSPRFVLGDYSVSQVFVPLDERRPLQHFQQGVEVTGSVEAGPVRAEISGTGFRDRTWGYRDESAHITEYAALIACFEDHDLTVMKFDSPTGMRTQGFALGTQVIDATELRVTRNPYALLDSAEVTLADRTTSLAASLLGEVRFAVGETGSGPALQIHDEFVRLEAADGTIGHGLIEQGILHRVF